MMTTTRPLRADRASICALAVFLAAAALSVGCKVDPERADAAPADAAASDGGAGDASADGGGPCPDGVPYTVLVTEWTSGAAFGGVDVSIASDADRTATTASDGTAELCLPEQGARVVHDHPDAVAWWAEVDGAAAAALAAAGGVFRVRLISPAAADQLYAGLDLTRDPAATQVVVDIRAYPGGAPVAGTSVQLRGAAFAGPFVGTPGGAFGASDTLAEGDEIALVPNVLSGDPAVDLVLSPPDSLSCSAPDTAPLEPGAFVYVQAVCSPAN